MKRWMLYGATGAMGKMILQETLKKGLRPVLAGRSAEKLQQLAATHNLEWQAFDLSDSASLNKQVQGFDLVLNVAGPFNQTSLPLVQACIANKVHYLDITNELEVLKELYALDETAKKAGIAVIGGIGYGTVTTNFLAKKLAEQMPQAVQLEVALLPFVQEQGTGTVETVLQILANGGRAYKDGKLINYRLGKGVHPLQIPNTAPVTLLAAPLGDLIAAARATNIPNVIAYTAGSSSKFVPLIMPLAGLFLKSAGLRRLIEKSMAKPSAKPKAVKPSYSWASVADRNGNKAEAWVELGEGNFFTVQSSLLAVQRIFDGKLLGTGSLTPAQAFTFDFLEELAGSGLHLPTTKSIR